MNATTLKSGTFSAGRSTILSSIRPGAFGDWRAALGHLGRPRFYLLPPIVLTAGSTATGAKFCGDGEASREPSPGVAGQGQPRPAFAAGIAAVALAVTVKVTPALMAGVTGPNQSVRATRKPLVR